MCSLFAFFVGGSLEVMQSKVDTRPFGRGGAVPSLHPSFLETAKRGHDAGSETRSSSCSPPPKQQSQDATARGGPPASTFTPSIHARRQATATAKAAKELRSPRVQGVSRSLPRCACADLRCACPCVSAFSSANKGG